MSDIIVVKQLLTIKPNLNTMSTVYQTGNITEIITSDRSPPNSLSTYKKVDSHRLPACL